MNKIGIISFHRSYNYGSVLQAYALQKMIHKLLPESDCKHIDYYPPNIGKVRSPFVPVKSARNLVRNLYAMRFWGLTRRRAKAFDRFVDENLNITEKSFYQDDYTKGFGEFDTLIAGSDQIWNITVPDFSLAYTFCGIKGATKIAYAPSIGAAKLSLGSAEFKQSLKEFYALSSREEYGARQLEKALEKKEGSVPVVLDPTLLLSAKEYKKLCAPRAIKEKYIFFYSLNQKNETLDLAKSIANNANLPIYSVFSGQGSVRLAQYKIKVLNKCAPEDFLSLIANAEYIITDSFHGTAFSVIFKKQFCVIQNKDVDYRIEGLLSKLGLTHTIKRLGVDEKNLMFRHIDYTEVQVQLEEQQNQSVEFLKKALMPIKK